MLIVKLLKKIHRTVSEGFTYKTDMDQYAVAEKWVMQEDPDMPLVGDCEDFALSCRVLCRMADIKSRLVTCWTETGGYHAVLEVDGWILDNRQKFPVPRDDLEYKWHKISGYNPGDPWHLIEG